MLRKLLSSTSQKKLQLIEYLLDDQGTSLHDLALKFSISMSSAKPISQKLTMNFRFWTYNLMIFQRFACTYIPLLLVWIFTATFEPFFCVSITGIIVFFQFYQL